jgi:hypothetical protein
MRMVASNEFSSARAHVSFRRLFVSFACLVALSACGKGPMKKELQRIQSPDHLVDAVVAEVETDATVATPYLVFIVPAGSKDLDGEPVMRGDKFDDLKITWASVRLLDISFSKGRIFNFTNFWESRAVQDFRYVVEVRLKMAGDRSLD